MKALYSLVCRLRTFYALAQGMATLVFEGWAALAPAQWLLLACGFGIAFRVLVPSPARAGGGAHAAVDRLLSVLAGVSVVGLTALGSAGPCATVGRLILGS